MKLLGVQLMLELGHAARGVSVLGGGENEYDGIGGEQAGSLLPDER